MLLKINKSFFDLSKNKLEEGQIIEIKDNQGIPLDKFWRARLQDSVKDNCVHALSVKEECEYYAQTLQFDKFFESSNIFNEMLETTLKNIKSINEKDRTDDDKKTVKSTESLLKEHKDLILNIQKQQEEINKKDK